MQSGTTDTIFEFVVGEKGNWEHWNSRVPLYTYPTDTVPEYTSILVPNVDNTRYAYTVQYLYNHNIAQCTGQYDVYDTSMSCERIRIRIVTSSNTAVESCDMLRSKYSIRNCPVTQ